ncbi:Transposon Tf2-9 polyprotein [Dictyocoela muelleri]|nr:Transposon Tf2-9 polyprotein [Dictyocoela muelleri]
MKDKMDNVSYWADLINLLRNDSRNTNNFKTNKFLKNENLNNDKQIYRNGFQKKDDALFLKCELVQTEDKPMVLINGRNKYEAILDTGADISLISAEVAKKERLKPDNDKRKINQAVGHFNTVGSVTVKLKYENKIHTVPLHVVENLHVEIIIGTDILKKLNIDPLNKKTPQILVAEKEVSYSFSEFSEKLDIGDENTSSKIHDFKKIWENYSDIFTGEGDVRILDSDHTIELMKEHNGFKCPKYRHSKNNEKIIEKKVSEFLEKDLIEESKSCFISPVVLVKKKNEEIRFCIDYRKLNSISIKKEYPIPLIEDALNNLSESKYFSTLDMKSGYHQIRINKRDKYKSAFYTKSGVYQWKRMPFELINAPFTFQRVMNKMCGSMLYSCVFVYLDDVIIFSKNLNEHLDHIKMIFEKIRKFGFRLNIEKCKFLKSKVSFLGFDVENNQISIPEEKKKKALNFEIKHNLKGLRSFSGFSNYFQKFIKNYSEKMLPIYNAIKKKRFDKSCISVIEQIKLEINEALPLKLPNFHKKFTIFTDASNFALGGVLTQKYNDEDVPIFFYSRKLTLSEINYTTTEKECLAIISSIKHWRHYLCNKFTIKTDHQALTWLMKNRDYLQRLSRWNMFLQNYDYEIKHITGDKNVLADIISRNVLINNIEKMYDTLSQEEKKSVISRIHEETGHGSIEVTYLYLIKNYYWPGAFKDIKDQVNSCIVCSKFRKKNGKFQKFRNKLKRPFECVQIDIIGPLPKSISNKKFIIMAIDTCTRWIEAKSSKTKTSTVVAEFIINEIIVRHGPPVNIISDNGKEFTAEIIQKICEIVKTRKSFVTSYNPRSNGTIERCNQTLLHKLSKLCNGRWSEWDEFLSYAIYATRISPRKKSGVSSFELLYGYSPPSLGEIDEDLENIDENDDMMMERLKYVRKILIEDEKQIREREILKIGKGQDVLDINVGDVVLRNIPLTLRTNKLDFKWEGPYVVISKGSKGNYKIKSVSGKDFSVNRRDLQRLLDSEEKWDFNSKNGGMLGDCNSVLTLL